ncbi:hypothetical protein NW759_004085 [Fusarium solani]|nr:hypothetical protein NW759_004085 [Fusarium solani]
MPSPSLPTSRKSNMSNELLSPWSPRRGVRGFGPAVYQGVDSRRRVRHGSVPQSSWINTQEVSGEADGRPDQEDSSEATPPRLDMQQGCRRRNRCNVQGVTPDMVASRRASALPTTAQ